MPVILSLCDCCMCVALNESFFLCLNIFQTESNGLELFLNAIPRDSFFYEFLVFVGPSQIFEVKCISCRNRFFYDVYALIKIF